MQTAISPLVSVYQTQLEASRRFADAIFSGTEKIDRVMLDAIHRIFNQQLTLVHAMATARDPQSVASMLQSKMSSHRPDDTMNYQKEVMRIFAEMQNDISRSLQDYIEKLGTNAAASAAAPLATAQTQANDAIYNPVTSVFSVWENAFKEAAALARKNMEGTRSAFEGATSRTVDNAAVLASAAGAGVENLTAAASSVAGSASTPARSALTGDGQEAQSERRGAPGGDGGRRK